MRIKDGGWELVDYDFESGRSVWRYDDGQRVTYRTDTPVDYTIRQNRQVSNLAAPGWKGDYHRVASIPMNVVFDSGLAEAHGEGDDRFVSKWLNDSDNRAWRTKEGTL